MNVRSNKFFSDVSNGLSSATWAVPFALAVGCCSGAGLAFGFVPAVAASLFAGRRGDSLSAPSWLTLLLFGYAVSLTGAGGAALALIIGSLLAAAGFLLKPEFLKKFGESPVYTAFLLATAFLTTALQTTNYFGIGAEGSDIFSIMRSYISLGFHANWRGVLYGTIVMVIMITFPRKFKKFSRKISAPFIALVVTLILNLFLNPVKDMTAIAEVGDYDTALSFGMGHIYLKHIPLIIVSAAAFALMMITEKVRALDNEGVPNDKRAFVQLGAANFISAVLGGCAAAPLFVRRLGDTKEKPETRVSTASGIVCAAVTACVYFFARPAVSRIPTASLAVVLIVFAWQYLGKGRLSACFKSGGKNIALFAFVVLLTLAAGPIIALPVAAAIFVITQYAQLKKQ